MSKTAETTPAKPGWHAVLPARIDASTMIVRTRRSLPRYWLDVALTALAWVAFIILFGRGIVNLAQERLAGIPVPFWQEVLPTMRTLLIYALVAIVNALILFGWAGYNWWRFRGESRRRYPPPLSDEQLLQYFGIAAAQLAELRRARIVVAHHTPEGRIAAFRRRDEVIPIDSGAGRDPSRAKAVQTQVQSSPIGA